MELSRRHLLKSALVVGGTAAVSREMVFGSLSEQAVAAGRTTANGTFGPGTPNATGYRKVVAEAGGQRARAHRHRRRRQEHPREGPSNLLAFAQLSDVHVVDHQSPARVEWTDRYDDPNPTGQVTGHLRVRLPPAGDALRPRRRRDGPRHQRRQERPRHRPAAAVRDRDRRQLRQLPVQRDPLEHRRARRRAGGPGQRRPRPLRGRHGRRPALLRHPLLAPGRHPGRQGRRPLPQRLRLPDDPEAARRRTPAVQRGRPEHPLVHLLRQPRRPLPGQLPDQDGARPARSPPAASR